MKYKRIILLFASLLMLALSGLSCVRDPTSCSEDSECFLEESCQSGVCVPPDEEPDNNEPSTTVCGQCQEGFECEPISKLCVAKGTLPMPPTGAQ